MTDMHLTERVLERIREWNIVVQDRIETQSSIILFGTQDNQPVVLKVSRYRSDEWHCGEVLDEFNGAGVVRVIGYIDGAVLLERLNPGTSLVSLSLAGRDDEATDILADVIRRMNRTEKSIERFITVRDWERAFHRYLASGDNQVPMSLVEQGHHWYIELCATEQRVRLLHGDLQHYNTLFDTERGWTAIDPKGVVGEIEYEVGASLRNPYEKPELLSNRRTIERRLRQYEDKLKLDSGRAMKWAFAQAVLSAIWTVEEGFKLGGKNPSILLANEIRRML
jgi:streptomycin 6-kinase